MFRILMTTPDSQDVDMRFGFFINNEIIAHNLNPDIFHVGHPANFWKCCY